MLFYIFSLLSDFLCTASIIFLRGGLAKFARTCAQLRGNIVGAYALHSACLNETILNHTSQKLLRAIFHETFIFYKTP